MGPVLYKKLPYDPMKSFTHIALIAKVPAAVVVNQAVPVKSVKELVELAKSKPNAISFGSSGSGSASRLFGELFKLGTGAPMTHVPYKGSGLATVDLAAGNIQAMFDGLPSHMAQIRAGKLKVLAALGPNRSIALPDVPTIAEAGYPGIECALWFGVSGPAGTPAEVVTKISREVTRITALEDVRTRLATVGAIPSPLGPAEYASFIRAENAKWGKVVAASGATED
jgi:tripartite-type tricarboxylate transporter receptor subunit TctC